MSALLAEMPLFLLANGSAGSYCYGCEMPRLDLARNIEDFVGFKWLLLGRYLLPVSTPKAFMLTAAVS